MPIKKTSKNELLTKSAQVFRENGYSNTSISDLSKVCGVHNANFYYYFTDKENLMEETLKFVHEFFLENAIKKAYDESLSPEERLDKMLNKLEKIFLSSEGGCIMGNIALETAYTIPKLTEIVKIYFNDWISALKHIYKFRHDDNTSQELAELTVQDVEGGIMLYRIYKDKTYILKALQRARKRFKTDYI